MTGTTAIAGLPSPTGNCMKPQRTTGTTAGRQDTGDTNFMRHTSARNTCAGNIAMSNGTIASGATGEITTTDITVIVIAGTRANTAEAVIATTATKIEDY